MKKGYTIFIKDIIDSMNRIEEFVSVMTLEELMKDDKTSSAVIRKFEIIGEAAKNVPKLVKDKQTDISWKAMIGMRDRLIHAYFGIDFKLVWLAIKKDIPEIKPKLQKILNELEESEE
ncbi:MAG: DUF86 domain-containing protein [Candidatus Aenigmarchaeota archaeon]|nr:DUF86 domain-containing protein [Candidatus Aenigmarchaeota archaeon]